MTGIDIDVEEAITVDEAKEKVGSFSPDVVILDDLIPGMYGKKVDGIAMNLLQLKPGLKIIGAGVQSLNQFHVENIDGCDAFVAFILKPFTSDQLVNAIKMATEGK